MGRKPDPRYSLIDSQRVKTTDKERGIDEKRSEDVSVTRKRHIVTDTQGHLLHVKVHAANTHETVAGYRKTMEEVVEQMLKKTVQISARITPGWSILAKRWIVESPLVGSL